MKIIHVDDHIYALEEMELDLPRIVPEAELHCFDHPDPALAFAETEGCDLLLTEIELWSEKLGGIRLAKEIRKINPRVQIIFVTVYSEHEVARELADLPVSGFIPKPWMPEKLAAAFQNLRDPKETPAQTVNHAADAARNKEEKSMKHRSKKLWSILLALTLVLSLVPAFSMTALADGEVTTYTLQIPSTLTVSAAGWNATSGLTASVTTGDTFDSGKKLTVTAASANSWALKSGSNSVGYNLATATGTYSSTATPASWEFTAAELNASGGTNKDMGIIVEDYSNKPAGTYQDTVTFTAKVEDAAPATVLSSALVDGAIIKVNFKWRMDNSGDYVQGTYNADSGTFTVSKGGSDWGRDSRAVYKVEKSGDNIIIGAGFYDYADEAMVWTFNTTNDTYTTTNGVIVNEYPGEYGLISVTLNGTDITSQLTKQ